MQKTLVYNFAGVEVSWVASQKLWLEFKSVKVRIWNKIRWCQFTLFGEKWSQFDTDTDRCLESEGTEAKEKLASISLLEVARRTMYEHSVK